MAPAIRPVARAVLAAVALALLASGCNRTDERAAESTVPAAASTPEAHDQHPGTASHDAHAGHGPAPVLAEGERWATDQPLRAAMTRIREAVERNAPAYDQQQLQAADAETLAIAVEQDITYMVANCRLEPEPDAALHAAHRAHDERRSGAAKRSDVRRRIAATRGRAARVSGDFRSSRLDGARSGALSPDCCHWWHTLARSSAHEDAHLLDRVWSRNADWIRLRRSGCGSNAES